MLDIYIYYFFLGTYKINHLIKYLDMFVRSDTEADDAFLNDSGSQYNSLVGILFCRTTTPLFNQVNDFYFFVL